MSFLWFQRIWINYTLFYLRGNIMNVKVGPFIFVFNKLHSPKGPHLVKRIRFIVTLSFQYWNRPNMLWFSHFASKSNRFEPPMFSLLENIIVVNYSFWRWWILKKKSIKKTLNKKSKKERDLVKDYSSEQCLSNNVWQIAKP